MQLEMTGHDGTYNWVVEGVEVPADGAKSIDIENWVNTLIANHREIKTAEIREYAANAGYPLTTADGEIMQDEDEYIDYLTEDLDTILAYSAIDIAEFIAEWATPPTKITRRSRVLACVTTTPGEATVDQCQYMTPGQIAREYNELRRRVGVNASIFITLYHRGRRMTIRNSDIIDLGEDRDYQSIAYRLRGMGMDYWMEYS